MSELKQDKIVGGRLADETDDLAFPFMKRACFRGGGGGAAFAVLLVQQHISSLLLPTLLASASTIVTTCYIYRSVTNYIASATAAVILIKFRLLTDLLCSVPHENFSRS